VHTFIDSGEPMAELLLHLLEAKRQGSHVVAVSCSQDYLLTRDHSISGANCCVSR